MGELTPEAKAAIEEAVRIVAEDRNDRWWRQRIESWNPPREDKNPPPEKNDPDAPKPPDPKDNPSPEPDVTPKRSIYWGVFAEDGE